MLGKLLGRKVMGRRLAAMMSLVAVFGFGRGYAQEAIPPVIHSFSPTSGYAGHTTVTIEGTNIMAVESVRFNGVEAHFYSWPWENWKVNALVPEGATTGPITVVTPGGTAISTAVFEILAVPPEITGMEPAAGAPGDTITVSGSNFVDIVSVRFNGVEAEWVSMYPLMIVATVPAGASTGPITVLTRTGTATSAGSFTVYERDHRIRVSSFEPKSAYEGVWVEFHGTNLHSASSVRFNGTEARFSLFPPDGLVAYVPTNASSGPITLENAFGSFTTADPFTVLSRPPPVVSKFSPEAGPVGTFVTVLGDHLERAQVIFSPDALSVDAGSDKEVAFAVVPTNAVTGPLTILTSAGRVSTTNVFTVTPPPARGDLVIGQRSEHDFIGVGHDAVFIVTLTNRGPDALGDVVVTNLLVMSETRWLLSVRDVGGPGRRVFLEGLGTWPLDLPELIDAQASQGTSSVSSNTVTWKLSSIAPGESPSLRVWVRSFQSGHLNQMVVARSAGEETDFASNYLLGRAHVLAPRELRVRRRSLAELELVWAAEPSSARLQSLDGFSQASQWNNIPADAEEMAGCWRVIQPIGAGAQFFRLSLPPE